MASFRSKDCDINFESHGFGEPVVAVYGFAGNTNFWQPQVQELSKKFQFIPWDLRAHGQSGTPSNQNAYGVWQSVEDLKNLLDFLNIPKAHIIGQSFGGGVAARFALRYPQRVKKLLLCNSHSASGLKAPKGRREFRLESILIASKYGMKRLANFMLENDPNISSFLRITPRSEFKQLLLESYLTMTINGFINSTLALMNSDDISSRLCNITTPTLLITGENDPARESVCYTHSEILNSQLVELSNSSHLSNLDSPQDFNRYILQFLEL